jgi:MFS family permease
MSDLTDLPTSSSVGSALAPIMLLVLVAFLVTGLALPVLPLYVHHDLKLSTSVVGLVTGAQFAASLFSRVWAGHFSDNRGAKPAVVVGLSAACAAGLIYAVAASFSGSPVLAATTLIVGRAMLGAAESFIITGALSWGLSLVAPSFSGKVISWVGTAMYAALAVGAPIGTGLYSHFGFDAIAVTTTLLPLLTLGVVWPLRAIAPRHRPETSVKEVLTAVALPGSALALASIGFGSMTTFVTLLFVEHGWHASWLPFSLFASSFIVARMLLGHLPDRHGGARIASVFVLLESLGQVLVWFAAVPSVALVGAVLTGFGYSLVYPALGVEAVRRVPAANRGLAMGTYTAFLDAALGIANPALGFVAHWTGLSAVFLIGGAMGLGCAVIAIVMRPGECNA